MAVPGVDMTLKSEDRVRVQKYRDEEAFLLRVVQAEGMGVASSVDLEPSELLQFYHELGTLLKDTGVIFARD